MKEYSREALVPLILAVTIVVAAAVVLIWFGRLRPTHPSRPRDVDLLYGYTAGVVWSRGLNPYDDVTYQHVGELIAGEPLRCNFAYAPTAAALLTPLAMLTPDQVRWGFAVLNVASALIVGLTLAAAVGRRLAPDECGRWRPLVLAGVAALTIASPQASLNLYQGQTSLFCLALICLAFWADERGRPWICGALLGAATFKILLPAVVIALLLPRAKWKAALALAATVLLLAAPPIFREGPIGLARDWIDALRHYRLFPQNDPAYTTSFGAADMFGRIGVPQALVPLAAAAGLAWLSARRRVLDPLEALGVALALPVLFVSGHFYDAVALAPLAVAVLLATRAAPAARLGAAAGVVLLVLPPAVWNQAFSYRWGIEVVALALLAGLMAAVEVRGRRPSSLADPSSATC